MTIKHIKECETCLKWLATYMVCPLKGYPTKKDELDIKNQDILARREFWKHNKGKRNMNCKIWKCDSCDGCSCIVEIKWSEKISGRPEKPSGCQMGLMGRTDRTDTCHWKLVNKDIQN